MSKAILKFNLSDFDDRMEFRRTNKALDMASVLWTLIFGTKREMEDLEDEGAFNTTVMWDKLNELLEEHSIDIESIIN